MKTNKEFIDGIYAKAEMKKHSFKWVYSVMPVAAVAVIAIVVLVLTVPGVKNDNSVPATIRSNESIAPVTTQAYVEGTVTAILEETEGYRMIQVKLDQTKSNGISAGSVTIAYSSETEIYSEGDYISTSLEITNIAGQECFVMSTDGRD